MSGHTGVPRIPKPSVVTDESKVTVERAEWSIGCVAINTVSKIREELFAFAEKDPAFKAFMLSSRAPDDARCVRWLIARLMQYKSMEDPK
jgi:hypothetical protein